jgi:hypothetical protein
MRMTVRPEVYLYPVEDGYVAEGPGFYVWDEDRSEVIRAVQAFARGARPGTTTRRLLRIETGPDAPASV